MREEDEPTQAKAKAPRVEVDIHNTSEGTILFTRRTGQGWSKVITKGGESHKSNWKSRFTDSRLVFEVSFRMHSQSRKCLSGSQYRLGCTVSSGKSRFTDNSLTHLRQVLKAPASTLKWSTKKDLTN